MKIAAPFFAHDQAGAAGGGLRTQDGPAVIGEFTHLKGGLKVELSRRQAQAFRERMSL